VEYLRCEGSLESALASVEVDELNGGDFSEWWDSCMWSFSWYEQLRNKE